MNVDQCKALGLVPYAVYGGKVESFKVREHAAEAYGDPVLLKALDQLIAERDCAVSRANTASADLESEVQAHKEQRANHLALWSSVAAIARRLLPEAMSFNAEDALGAIQRAMDELAVLKTQIAAGEPFDSDEIEAMKEPALLCGTCRRYPVRCAGKPINTCSDWQERIPMNEGDQ